VRAGDLSLRLPLSGTLPLGDAFALAWITELAIFGAAGLVDHLPSMPAGLVTHALLTVALTLVLSVCFAGRSFTSSAFGSAAAMTVLGIVLSTRRTW
jgi:hypothetical protein